MLLKFIIENSVGANEVSDKEIPILLNEDHIVSIKPIKMRTDDSILEGYWIRLTNGKKYKAIQVPAEIKKSLESIVMPKQLASFDLLDDIVQ
jgi:hypothetical protein